MKKTEKVVSKSAHTAAAHEKEKTETTKDKVAQVPSEKKNVFGKNHSQPNLQNDGQSPGYGQDMDAEMLSIVPQQYDPMENWLLNGAYLIVGKRRFGKTTCLRSILADIGSYYPSGVFVFSKTKHNGYWSQHVPEEYIYDHMDWDAVDKILAEQKRKRKERADTGKQDKLPYVLLILDDMISSRNDMRYQERMLALFFEGRHYDISVAICAQDIKGVPPDIRQNVDQIFLTFQTQKRQIDTIREDYADLGWPNAAQIFPRFVREYTHDHQLLVIDQGEAKENIADTFYFYNPDPEPEPFRLGEYLFWRDSGCDWKKQMATYKNVKQTDLNAKIKDPDVKKLYDAQWAVSDSIEQMKDYPEQQAEMEVREMKTTHIGAADETTRKAYYANIYKHLFNTGATKKTQDFKTKLEKRYRPTEIHSK